MENFAELEGMVANLKELDTGIHSIVTKINDQKTAMIADLPLKNPMPAKVIAMHICMWALAYNFIAQPVLVLIAGFFGHQIVPPALDMSAVFALLGGLLGMGGLHSYDMISQVAPAAQPAVQPAPMSTQ
jgi:hypothetical protein